MTLDTGDPEYIVTWAVLPLQLLWLGMGLLAARREMRLTMVAFLAVLLAGTAYFIFKLVRIWTRPEIYSSVRKSLSVFSVLSIIMIILTLVAGILVYRNFGKGLRRALDGRKEERKVEQLALSGVGVEAAPHRVTIE